MALNFEGPIAFDADAVPVNYFDQDIEDDFFLQPSPKEGDSHQGFPDVGSSGILQDASLFSPIPSSTREALDLASPSPATLHFPPGADDGEFSDIGRENLDIIRQVPLEFPDQTTGSSLESKESTLASFNSKLSHPIATFGPGGKLIVVFSNKPKVVTVKSLFNEQNNEIAREVSKSLTSLAGPLLVEAQPLDQYLESARLASTSSSLSHERIIARELFCQILTALYCSNEKPFEHSVARHLMDSLSATLSTSSISQDHKETSLSPAGEISNLFGEIDAVFKVDTVVELERLLVAGNLQGAQELALKMHSSSHGLVLSLLPHPPPSSYPAIIHFATSLASGPLRSLYLRVARYQGGPLFDDLQWRQHLLLALLFPSERSALVQLANKLEETIPEAANICYLIIGEPPLAQLTNKSITSHRSLACFRRVATPETLFWCEIFEYIHHRHLQAAVPEIHLDLQILKYAMAGMLNDFGHTEKAYAYVSSILQQGGAPPEFLETLQWFHYRLQQTFSQNELQLPQQDAPQLIPQVEVPPHSGLPQQLHSQLLPQLHHSQLMQNPVFPPSPTSQSQLVLPQQSIEPQFLQNSSQSRFFQADQLFETPALPRHDAGSNFQVYDRNRSLPPQALLAGSGTQQSPFLQAHDVPLHQQQPSFPSATAPYHEHQSPSLGAPDLMKPTLTGRSDSEKKKAAGGGWFSGIKKFLAVPEAKEANLEQDHSFYYDETLGRYVGTWKDEAAPPPKQDAPPPPPPPPPPPKSSVAIGKPLVGPRYALDNSLAGFTQ